MYIVSNYTYRLFSPYHTNHHRLKRGCHLGKSSFPIERCVEGHVRCIDRNATPCYIYIYFFLIEFISFFPFSLTDAMIKLVEGASSEMLMSPDWALNMQIVDDLNREQDPVV